jgi:hypothetical protein
MEIDINQIKELILSRADLYRQHTEFSEKITKIHSDRSYQVKIQMINNLIWVEPYWNGFPVDGFEIQVNGDTVTIIEHYLISDSISAPVTNYPRIMLDEFSITEREFLLFERRRERRAKLKKLFERPSELD